jgi:hypothetical protein
VDVYEGLVNDAQSAQDLDDDVIHVVQVPELGQPLIPGAVGADGDCCSVVCSDKLEADLQETTRTACQSRNEKIPHKTIPSRCGHARAHEG